MLPMVSSDRVVKRLGIMGEEEGDEEDGG